MSATKPEFKCASVNSLKFLLLLLFILIEFVECIFKSYINDTQCIVLLR